MPLGATFVFLVLCAINLWRSRRDRPPLTPPAESLACFVVLMMGIWAQGYSLVEVQMGIITSPFVFGTPENGWIKHVMPHLPEWVMGPSEEPYATGFYNGLRTGTPFPWRLWMVPVAAWTAFGLALALFCMGLAGILSRQWIDHDRLTFPHAEVMLGIARGFMGSNLFWWGFAAAAAIPLWNNVFQKLWPVLPQISLYFGGGDNGVEWFRGAWKIVPVLNIGLLGIFYFVHRDILISMIVFFFVVAIESYGLGIGGYKLEHGDVMAAGIIGWQTAGSIIAVVVFSLWAGRHALARIVRDAITGRDDGKSWLSPRVSLLATAVGIAGVTGWLAALGLREIGPLFALMGAKALGFIGMARVVTESGLEPDWPINASNFAVLVGGTAAIAPAGFVALALAQSWLTGSAWSSQLTYTMQAEKLRSQFQFPRGLIVTVLVAVVVAVVVSMYSTAWLSYNRGANNFGNWQYQWQMRMPYDAATEAIRSDPVPPDPKRFGWLGVGAAIAGGLIFLRTHVVGWFLHPIGLIIATMGMPGGAKGNIYVFTAMLVWLIKSLMLRLGGVESYEKYKALFAGIAVGHFLPNILGAVLDAIWFWKTGHGLQ